MAKTKTKLKSSNFQEMDGPYFLKLVLYLVVGTIWVNLMLSNGFRLPLPVGLLAGILFARRERLQSDRKIEYAVLLVAMLVGYFVPYGMYIQL